LTVLLVITVSEIRGAHRHVRDLMAGLRGHVRFLLATSGTGWLVEQAHALGVPVISLNIRRNRLGWRDFMAMLRLINVIRKEGVTIVHCHSYKAGLLGRFAALFARRPSVYTVHGFAFKDIRYSWIARTGFLATERILGKITTRVITVTQADFNSTFRLRIAPLSRLTYVPNGVDALERTADIRPNGQGGVVGTMTRLIQGKGVDELLEAIRLLLPVLPNIKLRVAGDGPWRSMLETRTRELGLQGQVQFLGWVEDVDDFLAGIDVFVLSSWKEAAQYALLDAMAHGKAIVATNVGGIPEVLHSDKAGLVVRPGDIGALAAAISFFVAHPDHRLQAGRIAQSIVRERFRRSEMLQTTYAVYRKVARGHARSEYLPETSGAEPDPIYEVESGADQ
jgi:glycosyltransferase involved in cell wall biosynthesis